MTSDERCQKIRELRALCRAAESNISATISRELQAVLVEAMCCRDGFVQRAAAIGAARLGARAATREVISALVEVMRADKGRTRRAALRTTGVFGLAAGTPEILEELTVMLRSTSRGTRLCAAHAAGKVGKATERLLFAIAKCATSDHECPYGWRAARAAESAVDAILATDWITARPLIARLLRSTDAEIRNFALRTVSPPKQIVGDDELLDALAMLMRTGESQLKAEAARAAIGLFSGCKITPVVDTLSAGVLITQTQAALFVGKLAEHDGDTDTNDTAFAVAKCVCDPHMHPAFLGSLTDMMRSGDLETRVVASRVAVEIGVKSPAVVDTIEELIASGNAALMEAAAALAGKVGREAATEPVLCGLAEMIRIGGKVGRHAAVQAVWRIGAPAATEKFVESLVATVRSDDQQAQKWACIAADLLGPAAGTPELIDALRGLLNSGDPNLIQAAARAVDGIGSRAARPDILESFENTLRFGDADSKRIVAISCRGLGTSAATRSFLTALEELINVGDVRTRQAAALAVSRIGVAAETPGILDALARLKAQRAQ